MRYNHMLQSAKPEEHLQKKWIAIESEKKNMWNINAQTRRVERSFYFEGGRITNTMDRIKRLIR